MEKLGIVAKKLNKAERLLSGQLRISAVLADPDKYIGQVDTVGGWVKNLRLQNNDKLAFVELSDGSSTKPLQVVIDHKLPNFADFLKENVSACIRVRGTLVKSPAKGQLVEMLLNDPEHHRLELLGSNLDAKTYPLMGKYPSLELLRNCLHLRPRSNFFGAMTRVRNALAMGTHQFFQELGFLYIHTPIITTSDCEGAGEMFQVTTLLPHDADLAKLPANKERTRLAYDADFFKKPASLTVSGQLAVENFACALTNVYTFGPTFRAENSHTTRHLAEFWMVEPEICFAGLEELFALVEGYFKFVIDYALLNAPEELEYFNAIFKKNQKEKKEEAKKEEGGKKQGGKKQGGKKQGGKKQDEKGEKVENVENVEKVETKVEEEKIEEKSDDRFSDLIEYLQGIRASTFKRISYDEAIEYLVKVVESGEAKFAEKPFWGIDLASEHERYICETLVKGPVFLYNYPKQIKAFYMKDNADGKTVQNMDLLLPFIGEVVGGSVREENLEVLEQKYKDFDLNAEDYQFYTDLRRFGTVPHAGFGVGFERLIMLVTGAENIRDVIPYPRYPGHCDG